MSNLSLLYLSLTRRQHGEGAYLRVSYVLVIVFYLGLGLALSPEL